jgi:hypothetical protein
VHPMADAWVGWSVKWIRRFEEEWAHQLPKAFKHSSNPQLVAKHILVGLELPRQGREAELSSPACFKFSGCRRP